MGKTKFSTTKLITQNAKAESTVTAFYPDTVIVNGQMVPDPKELNPGVTNLNR